ncbi:hypothetical protein NKX16_09305, partial [Streptococcus suis]|nr:hypothetical protein [Streptococcus suis]
SQRALFPDIWFPSQVSWVMIGIKVTPTTLPKSRFTIPPLRTHAGKTATNQEIEETLDHIRQHLQTADPLIQWTMNQCLVEIAVAYPDYLEQGLVIGQELAVYSDMKVPKGCTSAYAPDWIEALLRRK